MYASKAVRSSTRRLALACALAVIAYAPALRAPFDFDDIAAIVDNTTLRPLWPPNALLHTPERGTATSGRPVANFSFAVSGALNDAFDVDQRADPKGPNKTVVFHVVNVGLHIFCAVLLFVFVREALLSPRLATRWGRAADALAAMIASVWMLHPLQTEAVNYISQRTEVLVSVFCLLTLIASSRAVTRPRHRVAWSVVSVAACILGMATKEVMVVVPLLSLLYDRAFLRDSWREVFAPERRILQFGLIGSMAVPIALLAFGARARSAGFGSMSWTEYGLGQLWAVPHYLRLAIWPSPLLHDYGARLVSAHQWQWLVGAVVVIAVVAVTVVAWTKPGKCGAAGFVGAWFLLLLAPSSSIVPIGTEIAAERRAYLAVAAVITVGVLLVYRWLDSAAIPSGWRRRLSVGASVALLLLLAVFTERRSREYNDPVALWKEVIEQRPSNARGYSGLSRAILLADSTRLTDAEALLRRGISIDSTDIGSYTNLAIVQVRQNELPAAIETLRRAEKLEPGNFDVANQLGRLLAVGGDARAAMPYLERALQSLPVDSALSRLLGQSYLRVGRYEDAARALSRAVRVDSTNVTAIQSLALAFVELGRPNDALAALSAVRGGGTTSLPGCAIESLAYAEAGHTSEAIATADKCATEADADPEAFTILGRSMLTLHRADRAAVYFSQALKVRQNDPVALTGLGASTLLRGDVPGAVSMFRRALAADSTYEPAKTFIARLRTPGLN